MKYFLIGLAMTVMIFEGGAVQKWNNADTHKLELSGMRRSARVENQLKKIWNCPDCIDLPEVVTP